MHTTGLQIARQGTNNLDHQFLGKNAQLTRKILLLPGQGRVTKKVPRFMKKNNYPEHYNE